MGALRRLRLAVKPVVSPFLKGVLRRREKGLPEGALTFHRQIYAGVGFDRDKVRNAMREFGLEKLIAVHGIALSHNSRTTVIIGPQGIGKSTTLRRAQKDFGAKPIDDGIILLGKRRNGGLVLIETGTYAFVGARARASKAVRNAVGYSSPFRQEGLSPAEFEQGYEKGKLIDAISTLLFGLSPRVDGRKSAVPKILPLHDVVSVEHPRDPLRLVEVNSSGMLRISNGLFYRDARSHGIRVRRLKSTDGNIERQMLDAILNENTT